MDEKPKRELPEGFKDDAPCCASCRHCIIVSWPDDPDRFYCGFNSDRPEMPRFSNGNEEEVMEKWDLVSDWEEKHWVKCSSICTKYEFGLSVDQRSYGW